MTNTDLEQILSQVNSIIDLHNQAKDDLYSQINDLDTNIKLYQEAKERLSMALDQIGGVDNGLVDSNRLAQVGNLLGAQVSKGTVGP